MDFQYVFIRPSYFMQNLTTTLQPELRKTKQLRSQQEMRNSIGLMGKILENPQRFISHLLTIAKISRTILQDLRIKILRTLPILSLR